MPFTSEILTLIGGSLLILLGLGLIIVPHFILYRNDPDRDGVQKGTYLFVGIGMVSIGFVPFFIGLFGLLAPYLH